MKWNILSNITATTPTRRRQEISRLLFRNRGIKPAEQQLFINPPNPAALHLEDIGVAQSHIQTTVSLIKARAKESRKNPLVIYGDYDADGITSTAILWETLHGVGIPAMPFIPQRALHGYGLSRRGLDDVITAYHPSLVIAVDNGITAHEATSYARSKGIQVIVVDHHQPGKGRHPANALIHSTKVSAAGLSWLLSRRILKDLSRKSDPNKTLDLAAIGSVADLIPVVGANRSIVKHGIEALRGSTRPGLVELIRYAGLDQSDLDTYHLGYYIAPRLNAMGRIEHALESLRLLCTSDSRRARELAKLLNETNRIRQEMTDSMVENAIELAANQRGQPVLIVHSKKFHEGIIGLIAGKLAQQFWKPTVVIAQGNPLSKASARSIPGFDIMKAIRRVQPLLESAGGHPMAAGFTLKTERTGTFSKRFTAQVGKLIDPTLLQRTLRVDSELTFTDVSSDLLTVMGSMRPLGIGNPEAVFATHLVRVHDARVVGAEGKHLRLLLEQGGVTFPAIGFGLGHLVRSIARQPAISVAYSPRRSIWNGASRIELQVKDIA